MLLEPVRDLGLTTRVPKHWQLPNRSYGKPVEVALELPWQGTPNGHQIMLADPSMCLDAG